jgi:hypothetical protein
MGVGLTPSEGLARALIGHWFLHNSKTPKSPKTKRKYMICQHLRRKRLDLDFGFSMFVFFGYFELLCF